MKYLIIGIAFVTILISCGTQKSEKILPNDTCYTQVIFENIYAGVYPAPTVTATVFKIRFDSLHVGEEKNFHQRDSVYWVGYNFVAPDPTDPTHTKAMKSRINPAQDSVTTTYQKILPINILHDYNHTYPLKPAPSSIPMNKPQQ